MQDSTFDAMISDLIKYGSTMNIIKRNGEEMPYDASKIIDAITKANNEFDDEEQRLSEAQIYVIAEKVTQKFKHSQHTPTIEEIQNNVIRGIQKQGAYDVAEAYTVYRYKRALKRKGNSTDDAILSLVNYSNEEVKQENSNKNPRIAATQRDYMAGEVSKDITMRILLPDDVVEAHEAGLIHFHDADYFAQKIYNCCLANLNDVLENGTVISETKIDTPKSFLTACNIGTQVIAQTASNQYGGQTFSLAHLAPFVNVSRLKWKKRIEEDGKKTGVDYTQEQIDAIAEKRVKEEITSGIQMIQYQLLTLMTTNGQTPFVSMFIYLDEAKDEQTRDDMALMVEEVFKQRIKGIKNEKGVYVTAAFPKILYVLDEDNIHKDSKYYYLTELAAKCTAKRMVPDYISAKIMKEVKNGDVYPCMGCRSFLTPDRFTDIGLGNIANALDYDEKNPKHKYYGRFNQGVVTINLVDVACSSGRDFDKFWKILDERLELCHRALRCRHERLKGTTSDIAPILFQYGVIARLKKGEPIDKLLYNGYSTISLGYAGICEMCEYMYGKPHNKDAEVDEFAQKVMQRLNDMCDKWKKEENIDYSVYGTPLESTTYKFAKCLQNRWGIIKNVTDHNYITNSYHVNVREQINAFDKLKFESKFQKLSPGGAISYVEVPNMQDNIDAVLEVIDCIYNNIMYAELNTKSDYCMECGYDGEIKIVEEKGTGKLVWECPNCGNRDQSKMSVARRTCGYIGTQFWNQGRTQEIKDRVLHL